MRHLISTRWELLFDARVRAVLSHPRVLGAAHKLHSLGAALAEPSTGAQHWHVDAPALFDEAVGRGRAAAAWSGRIDRASERATGDRRARRVGVRVCVLPPCLPSTRPPRPAAAAVAAAARSGTTSRRSP